MTDEQLNIPQHLGFIVDGNRRWAKKHGLPTYEGHLAGYNAVKDVVRAGVDQGVKYMTFYIFSTENWKRSKEEVSHLMSLTLKLLKTDVKEFIEEEVRLRIIGTREGLSDKLIKAIANAEQKTAHFTRATVLICFNYGGQLEIVEAAQKCLKDGLSAAEITPDAIRQRLYAADVPDIDMMVRTSGEQRISNFMLWRVAYSELMFIDKTWPELRLEDMQAIIKEYSSRNRRFGGN